MTVLKRQRPAGYAGRALFVDPAATGFSWAIFDTRQLAACGTSPEPHYLGEFDLIVLETPRNYSDFSVAHADLDRLRAVVRKVIDLNPHKRNYTIYPSDWKGNVPKQIHHQRVLAALTQGEYYLQLDPSSKYYNHNTADAVALGMYVVGRTGRGGVVAV